jgi:Zn-dependent protease
MHWLAQVTSAADGVFDPHANSDLAISMGGGALILVGLGAMLRRTKLDVGTDDAGLRVAHRLVPWPELRGFQYGRTGKTHWMRVEARDGVIDLRDADLDHGSPELRKTLVERGELVAVPDARTPEKLKEQSRQAYEEWRRPAPPEPSGGAPVAIAPRARVSPKNRKKLVVGLLGVLALFAKYGKTLFVGGKLFKFGKLMPTALTMLGTAWVYALAWGWRFAVGFVLLIFVHEMGHALVIRAKGLRTGPIVFIPFFGAFIGIKDQFRDARTEAETAWGGPAAGALASSACFAAYLATGYQLWLGLAYVGFMLNLFNLLPVSPLDGGRVVTAISTWLWIVGLVAAAVLGVMQGSPLLIIIVLLGGTRAWSEWRKRRRGESTDYYELTPRYRVAMAIAYFGLCGYLGWLMHRSLELGGHV